MVDGARLRRIAIERIDWPATTARDISSRSANVSASLERQRSGGRIPVAFVTLTAANAFVSAGRLKAFAVTSTRRMPDLPGVPTFTELGYPDLVATTWFGVSGPPGMPPALVDPINAEIRKSLKTDAMQKMMANEGIQSQDWDAATFTHYVRSETDRWIPVVQSVAK